MTAPEHLSKPSACPNENKYGICFENCCLPESKERENEKGT